MKTLSFILFIILLASCSPQKRLYLLLKNHPELSRNDTSILIDTFITEKVSLDTVVEFTKETDTITVEKEKIKTQVIFRNDSVFIHSECPPDTFYKEIEVVKTVIEPVKPETKIEKVGKFLMWLLWFLIGAGVMYFATKATKKESD